jgi:hypothetical protein
MDRMVMERENDRNFGWRKLAAIARDSGTAWRDCSYYYRNSGRIR